MFKMLKSYEPLTHLPSCTYRYCYEIAEYGIYIGLPTRCYKHRESGTKCVTKLPCCYNGCEKLAVFSKCNKCPTYCNEHKRSNMIKMPTMNY